jgi:hypothetical protein
MVAARAASGKGSRLRGEVRGAGRRNPQRETSIPTVALTPVILALLFTQPEVFSGSWMELVGTVTLVTLLIGAYRHFECHVKSCHRVGRFSHGHYKLCHVHHPHVPSDGRITEATVAAVESPSALRD